MNQSFVGFVDLAELLWRRTGASVRMVSARKRSIGAADHLFIRISRNTENGVETHRDHGGALRRGAPPLPFNFSRGVLCDLRRFVSGSAVVCWLRESVPEFRECRCEAGNSRAQRPSR